MPRKLITKKTTELFSDTLQRILRKVCIMSSFPFSSPSMTRNFVLLYSTWVRKVFKVSDCFIFINVNGKQNFFDKFPAFHAKGLKIFILNFMKLRLPFASLELQMYVWGLFKSKKWSDIQPYQIKMCTKFRVFIVTTSQMASHKTSSHLCQIN